MAVALDTDVVIGFLDRGDAHHGAATEAVLTAAREGEIVTSAITLAEVMTGARIGHHDVEAVRAFFGELVSRVLPIGALEAELAAEIRAGSKLRLPDALVLASAAVGDGVDAIVTGDAALARAAPQGLRVRRLGE
ncbi:MAG: type II toxin-antitoxin system VapC family toxin [Solirubrobacterales bacterium]